MSFIKGIIDKMEMEPHHHQPSPLAQANDQSKSQPSSSIRCPELSCHLHQRPNTDCSVQTFFVYHGVTCESCVEDVCSDHHPHGIGSRGIPPSGNFLSLINLTINIMCLFPV